MANWTAEVLSLLEEHTELSTHRIVREIGFADLDTAKAILKPMVVQELITSRYKANNYYWAISLARRPIKIIQPSIPEPTRAVEFLEASITSPPEVAPIIIKTDLEDWRSTQNNGLTIFPHTSPELLKLLAWLSPLLLTLEEPGLYARIEEWGGILRKNGKFRNYDWVIEAGSTRWVISIVLVDKNDPFWTIRPWKQRR